jgi:O-antigen/teichoic acid export membrane protein
METEGRKSTGSRRSDDAIARMAADAFAAMADEPLESSASLRQSDEAIDPVAQEDGGSHETALPADPAPASPAPADAAPARSTSNRRRLASLVRGRLARDTLLRSSALLVIDNVTISAIGGICSLLAARLWPATAVGTVAAVAGALGLIVAGATLGMPSTVIKFLKHEVNQAGLMLEILLVTCATGAVLALAVVVIPGHLGVPVDHLGAQIPAAVMMITYALATTITGVADPAFIARQEVGLIMFKDVTAVLIRVVVVIVLADTGATGLFGTFVIYASVAAAIDLILLRRQLVRTQPRRTVIRFTMIRARARFAAGNQIATLVAMIPLTLLPTLVAARLGTASSAYVAIALQVVLILTMVPAMTSQALLAELSDRPEDLLSTALKALRGAYLVTVPVALVVAIAAPDILMLFGHRYSVHSTAFLRWAAAASLFFTFNYVGDVVLVARSKIHAYGAVNIIGTLLIVGFLIAATTPGHGLTWLGPAWFLGQLTYMCVGASTIAWFARHRTLPGQRTDASSQPPRMDPPWVRFLEEFERDVNRLH